jgi:hypothetical protein
MIHIMFKRVINVKRLFSVSLTSHREWQPRILGTNMEKLSALRLNATSVRELRVPNKTKCDIHLLSGLIIRKENVKLSAKNLQHLVLSNLHAKPCILYDMNMSVMSVMLGIVLACLACKAGLPTKMPRQLLQKKQHEKKVMPIFLGLSMFF